MNEGLENQNKSLKAFEIEERKLNLTFLLTSQSESPIKLYVKDAIKHYVKDDISSNFDMSIFFYSFLEIMNNIE